MTKPRISILSHEFDYVDAAHTDIRERFAKVRREIAATKAERRKADEAEAQAKVVTLPKARGKP